MKEKVAIYCRLSEEDKNKQSITDESGSIQNQKAMLCDYAESQEWEIYGIYSDDDYAGAPKSQAGADRCRLCQMRLHRGRMVLRGHSYTATKKEKHLYRLHKGNYVCFVRAFFYGQADTEVWKMHRHISARLQQR